jgi:hypothetical protein
MRGLARKRLFIARLTARTPHPALRATFSRKVLGWVISSDRPRLPSIANHFL